MSWDEYNEWLLYGIKKGWISAPVCDTHDGLPLTEKEIEQWDQGDDPCIPVIRLYGHEKVFNETENNEEKHPVL